MTTFDAYTEPVQPQASPLRRPEALFTGGSVIGLRAASATGSGSTRTVSVWLYDDPPAGLTAAGLWTFQGRPAVTVTGPGTVVAATTDPDGNPVPAHLDLPVQAVGAALPGRAPYRLGVDPAGLAGLGLQVDPLRRHLPVRLRPECGDVPDCVRIPEQPAPLTPPDYDTLARDYAELRAMLLERLDVLAPNSDHSPADVTVTLLELMAHLGDLLHYRLDRIATETWLGTARRRASVTRHARLVDHPVPPATSAATFVQVRRAHPNAGPTDSSFVVQPGDTATDAVGDPERSPDAAHFTLETDAPVTVFASHAEVPLYDWTEADAVLTAGATSAVLVRPRPADGAPLATWLPVGSLLAFEVVAPGPAGAQQDWARRLTNWPPDDGGGEQIRLPLASYPAQVVRVTHAVEMTDPLSPGLPLVRVSWDAADALTRPVPVSVDHSGGTPRVGVARLGVLPAHHGLLVDGPAAIAPLDPLTGGRPDPARQRVADYLLVRAATAGLSCAPGGRPWRLDTRVALPSGITVGATRVTSLLRATAEGFSVVVDHDDDHPPRLRFRTGVLGVVPPARSAVTVRYEVGAGPGGLIAANTLTRLVRSTSPAGQPCVWAEADARVTARNLTPGVGGAAAVPLDDVRRDAPQAYAAVPRRAVLVSDLPPFATQVPGVARAAARRSWSGSWPVGLVAVELAGDVDDPSVGAAVAEVMDAVRMVGTEVVTLPATPVGLLVAVTVCLTPGTDPALARLRILAALRPGRPGAVFTPAAHPLGTSVYVSTVVAAVAGVPGVDAVRVTEARRLSEPAGTYHEVLVVGPDEIAVCDDDAAAPDRGRIELTVEGGR
ncbi:baseplate J/gp47 family protein [Micromonospora sp. NPDC047707]|uniref:baseplate J/gp47 family protein n=1 Tax=Micromonospora sp. NPDC047707 TaxID=3154498 RepID=UPI003456BEA0